METLASRGTYRVTIQQRTAARRALEWIGTSKAQLVFRNEISDLFSTLLASVGLAQVRPNNSELQFLLTSMNVQAGNFLAMATAQGHKIFHPS